LKRKETKYKHNMVFSKKRNMLQMVLPFDCRSLRRSSNLPYSLVINKI
jgi:hypothetical protein